MGSNPGAQIDSKQSGREVEINGQHMGKIFYVLLNNVALKPAYVQNGNKLPSSNTILMSE